MGKKTNLLAENVKSSEVPRARRAEVIKSYGKLPLYFIENKGQVDAQVSYYEKGAGHAAFFTKEGVVLTLTRSEARDEKAHQHPDAINDQKIEIPSRVFTEAVSLSFVGAGREVRIMAEDKMSGRVNCFAGNDKSKWRSNISTYGTVTYRDVYKGIDIRFYGSNRRLEHDVIVRPGGDPSMVKFAYKGVKGLKVTEEGDLEVELKYGKIIEKRPFIYQENNGERVAVDGSYRILNGRDGAFAYSFDVASYDKTKDLVIDPVLVYSTYLGGSGDDYGYGIAIDSSGAVYVTGSTTSLDFPITNPIQGFYGGGAFEGDVFISKINPSGTAIVYSTYLGGSGDDSGYGVAVDSSGAAYIAGETRSLDFPLMNPVQGGFGGISDAFITKINPTGSAIIYSTYLGGNSYDGGRGIAVDSSGAAYITGYAYSNFPLLNPIQGGFGGIWDAFITKINPTGSAIIYSTYLGGNSSDGGSGIAVDSSGAAYITGYTYSTNFPLLNPIQGVFGGGTSDAFITKINPAGTAIIYSTYLGGNSEDRGHSHGIAVDSSGAAYVTGYTYSTNFPLLNPIQGVFGGGISDAFITKVNPAGTAIIYSSYLGGNDDDRGNGIAVDPSGAAYIIGSTRSADFPLINPIQGAFGGIWDAFITNVNPTGTAIIYSTYLGGSNDDKGGRGIAVDSAGTAYVTGTTASTDFPSVNPIQGVHGGGTVDAYLSKITLHNVPAVELRLSPDTTSIVRGGALGYTVTAANTTTSTQCIDYWENLNLPNGSQYPILGELFGPINVCLNSGSYKTVHLTHGVPMSAPLGTYMFNAYVGTYPTPLISEAHFNFNVTAFGPARQKPQTSWGLIENGFRK